MHANGTARVRCVFAGTPEFAVPSLRNLQANPWIELVAVYTQPDRGAGRGRRAKLSSVKQAAIDLKIPVFQPTSFKSSTEIDEFRAHDVDLLVVAAYGLLLPNAIFEQPKLTLNVHASQLPRWRGAAPIQHAIMAGDHQTGISMMRIVEELDAGPVLLQRTCTIKDIDTAGSLTEKLSTLGADCLEAIVNDWLHDRIVEMPQNESAVVYAKKITRADRPLDWSRSAKELERQVRALNPTPVATMTLAETSLKIWSASVVQAPSTLPPGDIVAADANGIDVATGDGLLRITRLQPDGKRAMSAAEFVNGFQRLLFVN